MADLTERLAILAAVFTLVGCAHAGRGSTGRVMAEAEAERPPPAAPPGEAESAVPVPPTVAGSEPSPAPAPVPAASDPELAALRAQAWEAEEAAVRAGAPPVRTAAAAPSDAAAPVGRRPSASRGTALGMLRGVGWTLNIWGRVCFSHPFVAVVCIAGFPYYWGAAVGAVVMGGVIGAAVGSDPGSGAVPADRGRRARPRGPQHDEPPPSEWGGGAAVAQAGGS